MLGTSSVVQYFGGGGATGDPNKGSDYYNYMQAQWKDGTPFFEGGHGYGGRFWYSDTTLVPTKFYLSGDPVTGSFWSEFNGDGVGSVNQPHDKRFLTSSGPFDIASQDTVNIRFAIVWSRGTDHLDSVEKLKKEVAAIRAVAGSYYLSPVVSALPPPQPPRDVLGFDQNFPNPFSQSTTLRYSLPQSMQVRLAVYDILGREIALLVEGRQDAGIYTLEFDGSSLPAGIYLARIELDYLTFTKRMTLIR